MNIQLIKSGIIYLSVVSGAVFSVAQAKASSLCDNFADAGTSDHSLCETYLRSYHERVIKILTPGDCGGRASTENYSSCADIPSSVSVPSPSPSPVPETTLGDCINQENTLYIIPSKVNGVRAEYTVAYEFELPKGSGIVGDMTDNALPVIAHPATPPGHLTHGHIIRTNKDENDSGGDYLLAHIEIDTRCQELYLGPDQVIHVPYHPEFYIGQAGVHANAVNSFEIDHITFIKNLNHNGYVSIFMVFWECALS